jgi:hypothetical protein
MRHEGEVRVSWNRAELVAIREAIEITPNFIGRLEAREVLRLAFKARRHGPVEFERSLAETLANRIVPIDQPTAMARAKLLMAVRGKRRRAGSKPTAHPVLTAVPSVSAAA